VVWYRNHIQARPLSQALLIRHVLIHRDQYFKARLIRGREECAISQTGETRVPAGLAIVTSEVVTESLVDALVQKNPHLMAGEQGFSRFFQSLQSLLPADGGEPLQKALQAVSGLEVFEKCAHQDPRAPKSRRTGHNGGIANDDGLHLSIVPQLSTTRASTVADPDDGPVMAGLPTLPSEWPVICPVCVDLSRP